MKLFSFDEQCTGLVLCFVLGKSLIKEATMEIGHALVSNFIFISLEECRLVFHFNCHQLGNKSHNFNLVKVSVIQDAHVLK